MMKRIGLGILFCWTLLSPSLGLTALTLETVTPNQGVMGQALPVQLKGSGFDATTRVAISLDNGNAKAIIGAVETPGPAYDVKVVGTLAYAVDWFDGLHVIDLSNAAKPKIVGAVDTPGWAWGVDVAGAFAYVADMEEGLQVIDVSDPAAPQIIGTLNTPGKAHSVRVVGDLAYVADGESGLQVVDISTPANPQIIGTVDTPAEAYGVDVVGNLAFVADYWSATSPTNFQVIDISAPTQPKIIGALSMITQIVDVDVIGGLAYVASWNGMHVINVAAPAQPTIIGSVKTPGWAHSIEVVGNRAYVGSEEGLLTIDISDPQKPQIIGFVDTPGIHGVDVVGSTAYVAHNISIAGGVQAIDVSSPMLPPLVDFNGSLIFSDDVKIIGSTAYVVGSNGLQIFDLTDPVIPKRLGEVETPGWAYSLSMAGNLAYIADGEEGLHVIDVSDPEHPQIIGAVDTPGEAYGVSVAGTLAYVADKESGLQVIDISTPTNPQIIGSVDTPAQAYGVDVVGNLVLVTDYWSASSPTNFQVIDVSTPTNPEIIGALKVPGLAWDVDVVGNLAYVASTDGMYIINVISPTQPKVIGSIETPGWANSVTVVGNMAYVADQDAGLHLIDVTAPTNPKIFATLASQGEAQNVSVVGHFAYMAAHYGGAALQVVPLPQEVIPLNLLNASTLAFTLPSPEMAGNYTLRAFKQDGTAQQLPGAINFASFDFAALDPNLLDLRTIQGEIPPSALDPGASTTLQLIYKTPAGIPINLSNLAGQVTVQWLSSNSEVLSVSATGVVVAKAAGHATITAKISGGGQALSFQVTAPTPVETAKTYGNLIVLAGRNTVDEALGQTFQTLANMAYETFFGRGLEHDDIFYINAYGAQSIPGETVNVVDTQLSLTATEGSASISNAIKDWAKGQNNSGPLYLYLVDHGGTQQLKVTPKSILYAAELKQALDQFQSESQREVVVIIEACYSGTWKDTLAAPNRLVLTSTGDKKEILPSEGGMGTFSDYLFQGFSQGKSIEKAFTSAVTGVQGTAMGKKQSPLYAMGAPELWSNPIVGPGASAASFAIFTDFTGKDSPLQAETGQGMTLSSTLDIINKDWVEAYAILTPPTPGVTTGNEFETPALVQIKVPLSYQGEVGAIDYFGSGNKVFGGVSGPLTMAGAWELTYVVKDQNGELTVSSPVTVTVTGEDMVTPGDTLSLIPGWNLVGSRAAIDVASTFSNSATFVSLWKWKNGGWAVRVPGDDDGGAIYANNKGFALLLDIEPGEGFWVNSTQGKGLTIPGPPTADAPLLLSKGWNLVSLQSGTTKDASTLVGGKTASVTSMWKWVNNKWSVRLPGNPDGGQKYADDKGFGLLTAIDPGEGFWVNTTESLTLE